MKSISVCFVVALLCGGLAHAHDFWLEPEAFTQESIGEANVAVRIGHAEDLDDWPATPARIVALTSLGPDGIADQQAVISKALGNTEFPLFLGESGEHIVAITTTHAVSELEAEKFNAYVEEEGISPIRDHRAARGLTDNSGREIYSRRGKSIVQVGPLSDDAASYITRPLGLTLEITPHINPARLKAGEPLGVSVHYRGAPVTGATIHVVDLGLGAVDHAALVTDKNGHASLPRPESGRWMLHTVWSARILGNAAADYDTTFSSLSFGFAEES